MRRAAAKAQKVRTAGTDDKTCLVVDDEPGIGWAIKHLLETRDVPAMCATSGAQAISLIQQHNFAVVFLDLKLADIEGFGLARQIRKLAPRTRVILISAYFQADDPITQQALQEGLACCFISKPFRHAEVMKGLDLALAAGS